MNFAIKTDLPPVMIRTNDKKPFAAYPQRRAFIIWIVLIANLRE